MSNLFKQLKKLPDSPGVYFFKKGAKTLYIGKATSLRDRVQSYFRADLSATRGPLVSKVIRRADNLDFKKTGSVLEALLLEAELIKKIKPPGNSDGKDDKSANCVVITDEEYPKIILIRKREIEKG